MVFRFLIFLNLFLITVQWSESHCTLTLLLSPWQPWLDVVEIVVVIVTIVVFCFIYSFICLLTYLFTAVFLTFTSLHVFLWKLKTSFISKQWTKFCLIQVFTKQPVGAVKRQALLFSWVTGILCLTPTQIKPALWTGPLNAVLLSGHNNPTHHLTSHSWHDEKGF